MGRKSPVLVPAELNMKALIIDDDEYSVGDTKSFEEDNEADDTVESAAEKKKKKKKEKEKEKKAKAKAEAASVDVKIDDEKHDEVKTSEESMGPKKGKKVPKHVREMQEALARRKEAEEKAKREEEERLRREEEERTKQEEVERLAEEAKRRKKEREKEKLQRKKQQGQILSAKQKEEARRLESMRKQILSNSEMPLPTTTDTICAGPAKKPLYHNQKKKLPKPKEKLINQHETIVTDEEKSQVVESVVENDKSWDDDDDDDFVVNLSVRNAAFADEEVKSEKMEPVAVVNSVSDEESENEEKLRSPICCVMGHVDAGKTKLLDCIRGTHVQEGEAGGITQQIGATYFPVDNIRQRTEGLKADAKLKVPGLLVIDTPGHESFTALRSVGSGLCDIAVLVVDIMHGLQRQSIESLTLLKKRNTQFIIALNKVDRLYGWTSNHNVPIVASLKQQSKDVRNEFDRRLNQIITQLKEQGLNTKLYYENREMGKTYSIVPTSAITGEGIPDLLLLLVNMAQRTMVEKLTYSNKVQCIVLEVEEVEGHGTTIDVVLVNGMLHEGDQIVVCGIHEPIVTTIRALLTTQPMKELRVKGTYLHHKEIKAAQGIKITGQGLEHAIAGTHLYVVGPHDDLEDVKEAARKDMESVVNLFDKSDEGVCVQASTHGSLVALLTFLKTPDVKIPFSETSIGPVHKKDVMRASMMLGKKKEYATILAFDVKVTPEAHKLADELGVKIFNADVLYHLCDQFKAYITNLKEEKKKTAADEAVFPCVLEILNCFNKKDPILLGVKILKGIAKVGTPICIPAKNFIDIGRIASIEKNYKPVDVAKKEEEVALKIVGSNLEEQQKTFDRHFNIKDELVSHISRKSIDVLKANYRDDLSSEDWDLVKKLKRLFKIT